ncbi:xylulokinase [Prauserella marina]|uniref:Xylulose kinase n=1 Tax=Prauserella marina TaxID=530584 RepID=A0A222VJP9_9PSEU|nr:xylulokinase [Prauserella marina]ASR34135.1 xylulokinase [Prauserella marina]PWV82780.1 xylulokinase [Prauserella marina]SDC77070.1 xylulokinase [Prauserella marina]
MNNNGEVLVAGIDSSTQSTKVMVCAARTGQVVRTGRAEHPDSTEIDPAVWWSALREATGGLLDGVSAIGVAGQQHGMVTLDDAGDVVRPALLWNDTRSAKAAADLTSELGGPQKWAEAVGSVPVASFTVTKLRWMAENEPELADSVARVLLPHDWLTWRLVGGEPVTDRGDASGTGYFSPAKRAYRTDILATAFGGRNPELPRVLGPAETAGHTPDGVLVSAGTGDNMAAALALELTEGDVVVSLGTSGTVFGVSERPAADATGIVAGFADATGRFLPLACTLNAARVLTATAGLLGVELAELDRLALSAQPGADGLTLLPYLDGERTPNLPEAAGTLLGLRRTNMSQENLARAAVEGMLCGLAAGLEAVREHGTTVRRVLLIGGAAQSEAVRTVAPSVFGVPVAVPEPAEHVAIGAARQAAWALAGTDEAPAWQGSVATRRDPEGDDLETGEAIRQRHLASRALVHEL